MTERAVGESAAKVIATDSSAVSSLIRIDGLVPNSKATR